MYTVYCPWCHHDIYAEEANSHEKANISHQQHMRQHLYTDFSLGNFDSEISKQNKERLMKYLEALVLDKEQWSSY